MARNTNWTDDNWLLLLQAYLQRPVGIKPKYSRTMVSLSMELHIAPEELYKRMGQIASIRTPRLERIWETYSGKPRKLARAVRLLREMKGFNNATEFYQGVDINETFETDYRPIIDDEPLTPLMLILILDLYFRLTPITMVAETPEVAELARLMKVPAGLVAEVLDVFQHCDPYLNRKDVTFSKWLLPCTDVWRRYGNGDPLVLAQEAKERKEYFLS